jgi:hypothetical protein
MKPMGSKEGRYQPPPSGAVDIPLQLPLSRDLPPCRKLSYSMKLNHPLPSGVHHRGTQAARVLRHQRGLVLRPRGRGRHGPHSPGND